MRETDRPSERTNMPDSALIRRVRARRVFRLESADSIVFNVAAYKLDRELGIAEHIAVENNLRIITSWPDVLLDKAAQ